MSVTSESLAQELADSRILPPRTLRAVKNPVGAFAPQRALGNAFAPSASPTAHHSPKQNQLLAALPCVEFERLAPHLELVPMPRGFALHESGMRMLHVYFPTTSIISIVLVLADGASSEVAVVGDEGILGVSLFMGGETTPSRTVVQSAGFGYRIKAAVLKEEFNRVGALHTRVLLYIQALMTQVAQTAMCNRRHSVEQQVAKRLLMIMDRTGSNSLTMTQELIANSLGVRREGITAVAGALQRAGVIAYRRGHIAVLDSEKLEESACECYAVVKLEFKRLLSGNGPSHPFYDA